MLLISANAIRIDPYLPMVKPCSKEKVWYNVKLSLFKATLMLKSQDFYLDRQHNRVQLMLDLPDASMVVLPSSLKVHRNWDSHYPFQQDSNFYYLTGVDSPNAALVLIKNQGVCHSILFIQVANDVEKLWEGPSLSLEDGRHTLLFDEVRHYHELSGILPELINVADQVYYPLQNKSTISDMIFQAIETRRCAVRHSEAGIASLHDVQTLIQEHRVVKSAMELDYMRQAVAISEEAHMSCMKKAQPGMHEYELEALFYQKCRSRGADHLLAYNSIVGTGNNACVLHYINNCDMLKEGELLLIDAGCQLAHYASDLTRTYPTNGIFSSDQATLYNHVLKVQMEVIDLVRPGVTWKDLQNAAIEKITLALIDMGILQSSLGENIEKGLYKRFYPHLIGHWIGLDVHDPSATNLKTGWRQFSKGMVLTIEPGIYIPDQAPDVDPRWWGMGVRIEDNVLVTETGSEVLSDKLPKTIQEIEALMAKSHTLT